MADLTDTWPPRWTGPQFKKPIAAKVLQVVAKRKVDAAESTEKTKARRRDKFCRFPLCGCTQYRLALHVSHLQHKGMGGNPKGDRSKADKLILLCVARHQDNSISVHRGTLRIKPLTKAGTVGPCAFLVQRKRPSQFGGLEPAGWFEVGRERSPHSFEPFTPEQAKLLKQLGDMKQ